MRLIISLALLWFSFLAAEEEGDIPGLFEGVNYLEVMGGEPSTIIGGCVNALTGDYLEIETDIAIPGAEELSLKRFYCSSQKPESKPFCNWKFNHDIFVKTKESSKYIYPILNEAFGSQIPFRGKSSPFTLGEQLFEKRITNTGSSEMSGKSNLRNKSIHLTKEGDYYLKDGAGGSSLFHGGPKTEKAYVKQVIKPNFNSLTYHYDKTGLRSVDALNQSGISFGQLSLSRDEPKLIAKGTGQKKVVYHTRKVKHKWILERVQKAGYPDVTYHFDGNYDKIVAKKSNNRFLQIIYIPDGEYKGRVQALKGPLGYDETAIPLYRFKYFPLKTDVYDALNNLTTYRFGEDERLCEILKFKGKKPCSKELFFWKKGGDLLSRTLSTQDGKTLFCKYYEYDTAGNVLGEFVFGNLTGHNQHPIVVNKSGVPQRNGCEYLYIGHEYSKDGCNLITYENHPIHEHDLLYEYYPGTTLMRARFTVERGAIHKREFFEYDASGSKILEIIDNGSHLKRDNLTNVTERRIIKTHNTQSFPLGLPEIIEERYLDIPSGKETILKTTLHNYNEAGRLCKTTILDSEGKPAFIQTWVYNERGDIVEETDPLGQVTTRQFDEQGNKILEVRPSGVTYKYTYDLMNRLISEEENGLLSKSYQYDDKGNQVAATDIFGNETHFVYDALDREVKVIYPDNSCIEKTYDLLGNVSRLKDARGGITSYKYTLHGKPAHIQYADGSEESFFYSLRGVLQKKIYKNGSYTLYSNDYLSRPTVEERYSKDHQLLSRILRKYDAFHLLQETDAAGITVYYTYDGAGRLIWSAKEGLRREYIYDTLGRRHIIKEYYGPENHQFIATYKEFDALNRVTTEWIQDAQGNAYKKTAYVYDAEGNIIEKIADKNRTLTRYNFHGDPIEIVDTLGQVTRISYGYPKHHTIEITDPLGRRIKNGYDTLGRHTSEEHFNPLGLILQKTNYHYDPSGNCTEIVQGEKVTKYEFDSMNRPIGCIEAAESPYHRREETKYDINGNILEITKPDGLKVSYHYDSKNRLKSFSSSDGSVSYSYEYDKNDNWIKCHDSILNQTTERAYNALNHLQREKLANGLTLQYEHDSLGRIQRITLPDASKMERVYDGPCLTHVKRLSHKDELIYEHRYLNYSSHLNPLKVEMAGQAGTLEYGYDALDRVTELTSRSYQYSISYDPVGNVLKSGENHYTYNDLDQLLSESHHSYAYDALNNQIAKDHQIFSVNLLNQLSDPNFQYDLRGNCIEENDTSYHYDALDRLICVRTPTQKTTYEYDVANRRLAKSTYDLQGELLSHERYLYQKTYEIGSCHIDDTLQELRVLGLQPHGDIGAAIALEFSGKVIVPLHDSLGNLVHTLDPKDGSLLESFHYSAFSENATSSHIPWRFASKRTDPESGLIYFGHRYYNPVTSRWLPKILYVFPPVSTFTTIAKTTPSGTMILTGNLHSLLQSPSRPGAQGA